MRQNICIILNSKTKKDAYKELGEVLDLYKEDKNCNTEYEVLFPKSVFKEEYEQFKQKYRNLNPSKIKHRLETTRCKNIEEYIQYVLETIYHWGTLEDYVYKRYNIVRFEGDKCIGLYNPIGYIDYVDHVIACHKYKKFKSKDIEDFNIAEVILPDRTDVVWNTDKDCKSNKLIFKQVINRYANKNTYIAVVRVHF